MLKNFLMIIAIVLCSTLTLNALFFTPDYEKLTDQGISLYKQKNNAEAKIKLEEAISILRKKEKRLYKEESKAYYYLGNVLMNLHEYTRAIDAYSNSLHGAYDFNNSLFNSACAYSLLNEPEKAMQMLIKNYAFGDRKDSRIKNDPDLKNFRESAFYKKYYEVLSRLKPGIIPTNGSTIKKYIKELETLYNLDEINPGSFAFYDNGIFECFDCCGYAGWLRTGTWEINEQKKLFIIRLLGVICTENMAQSEIQNFISNKSKFLYRNTLHEANEEPFYWCKKYKNPVIDVIPFNQIRLNVIGLSQHLDYDEYSYDRYNAFGDFSKNNVIKNRIGGYIIEKENPDNP